MPEELVQHVIRVWAAEVENAERLSKKVNGLVSALALLFGLGLFKLDWTMGAGDVARIRLVWSVYIVKACLILALCLFATGLWRALRSIKLPAGRLRAGMTASDLLRFDKETVDSPPTTSAEANQAIFSLYLNAINELRTQNRERRARVAKAETFFLIGLVSAMLGIGFYLLTSAPSLV